LVNKRYPAHWAGFAPNQPAAEALIVKCMSTCRPQPSYFVVLELIQTDPALIYGSIDEHELQLDAAVFCNPTPFDFDASKERHVVSGTVCNS
jgi:hypothetical protein